MLHLNVILEARSLFHSEFKLASPKEVGGIHNLLGDTFVNDITSMNIHSNDSDDFNTEF
jgi:hypothetical protein